MLLNQTVLRFGHSEIDNCKEEEIWKQLQSQLEYLRLKIKTGMNQNATYIHSDPIHAKADKPRKNEAKTRKNRWNLNKKNRKSYFEYELHSFNR